MVATPQDDQWPDCALYRGQINAIDTGDRGRRWFVLDAEMTKLITKFNAKLHDLLGKYITKLQSVLQVAQKRKDTNAATLFDLALQRIYRDLHSMYNRQADIVNGYRNDFNMSYNYNIHSGNGFVDQKSINGGKVIEMCDSAVRHLWINLGMVDQDLKEELIRVKLYENHKLDKTIPLRIPTNLEQQIRSALVSTQGAEATRNADLATTIGKRVVVAAMQQEAAKSMEELKHLHQATVARIEKFSTKLNTILLLNDKVTKQMEISYAIVNERINNLLNPGGLDSVRCKVLNLKRIDDIVSCLNREANNLAVVTRMERNDVVEIIASLSVELESANQ